MPLWYPTQPGIFFIAQLDPPSLPAKPVARVDALQAGAFASADAPSLKEAMLTNSQELVCTVHSATTTY